MSSDKMDLSQLKEKLKKISGTCPGLECPFLWDLPPKFENSMTKKDLYEIIKKKKNEPIIDSDLEKVAVFLLECLVKFFLDELDNDIDQIGNDIDNFKQLINNIAHKKLTTAQNTDLKADLLFMVNSTHEFVKQLRGEAPSLKIAPSSSSKIHILGVKAWFNMNLYNYQPALLGFEKISTTTEYDVLYAFYHGKTMARNRRMNNDYKVTEKELTLLLKGEDRLVNLPLILQTFDNLGQSHALFFKYKTKFKEIVQKAWSGRDIYHSINLSRLASIYLRLDDDKKATELFQLAHKMNPSCTMTLQKYGQYLLRRGDQETGIKMLIEANHIPAFMTLVSSNQRNGCNLSELFNKIEDSNTMLMPKIRCVMFLHTLKHRDIKKAEHHLQKIYQDAKGQKIDLGSLNTERNRKLFDFTIPACFDVDEECTKLKKICPSFEKIPPIDVSGYTVHSIENLNLN